MLKSPAAMEKALLEPTPSLMGIARLEGAVAFSIEQGTIAEIVYRSDVQFAVEIEVGNYKCRHAAAVRNPGGIELRRFERAIALVEEDRNLILGGIDRSEIVHAIVI